MKKAVEQLKSIARWLIVLLLLFSVFCQVEDFWVRGKPGQEATAFAPLLMPGLQARGQVTHRSWFPFYIRDTEISLFSRRSGRWRFEGTLLERRQGLSSEIRLFRMDANTLPRFTPPNIRGKPESKEAAVWMALEEMPPHARVRFSFSTRHPVSPEGLLDMLSPYRLRVEWMPIWEASGPHLAHPLGIPAGEEGGITPTNLPKRRSLLMETLGEQSRPVKWLGETFDPAHHRQLLASGPLRVYGAVVEGSVEEILRLRGLLELRHPEIIDTGLH
ncbi:hypothetical protein [Salinithrix halophila]|uniref:Uncharacterized protein n=1 Tax=Salinithrix halophila TaxID=1485204 RepID=A0ABV8JH85_9BACL